MFYIIFKEFKRHFKRLTGMRSRAMEEYEDVESNALIAYHATDGTDATAATTMEGPQDQEAGRLQMVSQSELQIENN